MITSTLSQYVNTLQEPQDTHVDQVCALGHDLGNCPARRVAGCRNHYELLHYMYPPLRVLQHVRATMGDDPEARRWLADIDAILPKPAKWGGR